MPSRRCADLILGVCVLALAPSAHAARLTPEALLSLRSVEDVALSPVGDDLLYRLDRRRRPAEGIGRDIGELWHSRMDGGAPRRFATGSSDARQPAFSPDGERIAWLARTRPGELQQIYLTTGAGGAGAAITSAPSDITAFKWSPDGRRIAYLAGDVPGAREQAEQGAGRDWTVFGAPTKHMRLHILDVRTREVALLTKEDLSVYFFAWSPDSGKLVVAAAPSRAEDDRTLRMQPYVVDARGGALRQIAHSVGKLTDPVWSSDGQWIAWLASVATWDPHAGSVFVVPVAGGEPRNVTRDHVGSATWLAALPDRPGTFVFRSEEYQATALRTVDAAGTIGALATGTQVLVGAPSFSRDGRTFAVAATTPQHPAEAFLGRSGTPDGLRRVTNTNPGLASLELGTQEVVRWRSVDGLPIEGILVKPPGYRAGQRYPVILHVHGGSESVVSNGWLGTFNNWGQLLAARGYVVLFPNYRGSRGRGTDFVAGNRRDIMGREWEDTERGLDHLVETGIADGERAGIYGFSWGGYAAGWGATYASHRFKAAVAGAGFYNWVSLAGTNETRLHEQTAHWDLPLYENALAYLQRSPLYHVGKARTPLLLLHGERDESCPLTQAIEFHTALKWKGVPVELIIYPREGHGMVEYVHALDFAQRGLAWFARYLPTEP